MKKILSGVLALALVLCMVLSLASCTKMLSGKYTNTLSETSYEFSGNKVTRTAPSLGGAIFGSNEKVVKEGTYEIKTADDGSMTITFTWGEDDIETAAFTEIEVNGEKSIKIGLGTYTKE